MKFGNVFLIALTLPSLILAGTEYTTSRRYGSGAITAGSTAKVPGEAGGPARMGGPGGGPGGPGRGRPPKNDMSEAQRAKMDACLQQNGVMPPTPPAEGSGQLPQRPQLSESQREIFRVCWQSAK